MTQPTERQTHSPEKYIHHILDLAKSRVRDTNEYRELIGRGKSQADAFRKVAHDVTSRENSGLSEADRSLLRITGELGVYVQAEHELTQIHDGAETRPLDADEKWVAANLKREYAISFNHHLKDFVNTHPNDDIRTVSSALTNAYGTIFSRYQCIDNKEMIYQQTPQPREVFEYIQGSIDGMRQEVAGETLLEAADYSYDHRVSSEEDARGADLFVYLESGWEAVDIKASQLSAAKAHTKNRFSRAVWTGLDWGDFTGQKGTGHGMLSIPFATAEAKCDQFIANIRQMVASQGVQRASASQHAGSQSLRY